MLLNGQHLLADPRGVLFWPRQRLVAFADAGAPQAAALERVLAQYRPRRVLALGGLVGAPGERERKALAARIGETEWTWIGAAPDGLPGEVLDEATVEGIVFRPVPAQDPKRAEISGGLRPVAALPGSAPAPCFVIDGRRLILPAFGGGAQGTDVLAPHLRPLFRRGFHVLVTGSRIRTLPRARLLAEIRAAREAEVQALSSAPASGQIGRRMSFSLDGQD